MGAPTSKKNIPNETAPIMEVLREVDSSIRCPLLTPCLCSLPVVVIGNKVDVRAGDSSRIDKDLRDAAAPIMEVFSEVETCIECSAKKMINIRSGTCANFALLRRSLRFGAEVWRRRPWCGAAGCMSAVHRDCCQTMIDVTSRVRFTSCLVEL